MLGTSWLKYLKKVFRPLSPVPHIDWGLRSYLPDGHEDKKAELGLEKTPEEYVQNMVEVFRGVWRVLRDDGTVWLNLGSSMINKTIESNEMVLRNDLTKEEVQYVLEELLKYAKQP